MDRNEAIERLRKLRHGNDTEQQHADADDVLCELLKAIGYEDVVKEWEEVPKWYA